jgi:hypothetical protein
MNDTRAKIRALRDVVAGLLGRGRRAINRFVRRPEEPACTAEEMIDASAEQLDLVATCRRMDELTAGEEIEL